MPTVYTTAPGHLSVAPIQTVADLDDDDDDDAYNATLLATVGVADRLEAGVTVANVWDGRTTVTGAFKFQLVPPKRGKVGVAVGGAGSPRTPTRSATASPPSSSAGQA